MSRYSIALGARVPVVEPAATNQINPFQAGLDIMRMQQLANENKKFQIQMGANAAIGDIMSNTSIPLEQRLQQINNGPLAPFAGEFLKNQQDILASQANTAKTWTETGGTILERVMQGDSQLQQAFMSGRPINEIVAMQANTRKQLEASLPPATRQQGLDMFDAHNRMIFDGLPSNPADAAAEASRRLTVGLTTSGLNGDALKSLTPQTEVLNRGGGDEVFIRRPAMAGGGLIPTGQVIQRTPAPGTTVPGNQPPLSSYTPPSGMPFQNQIYGNPAYAGGVQPSQAQPPAPLPSQTGGQPTPQAPMPDPAVPTPQGAQPPAPAPIEVGYDGKPIFGPDTRVVGPPGQPGTLGTGGGTPEWIFANKSDATRSEDLAKEYSGKETEAYKSNRILLSQLDYMDNAVDKLADSTLPTGALADARYQFQNTWNTVTNIAKAAGYDVGPESQFSPTNIANMENLIKSSVQSQFSWLTGTLGYQREAAMTIATAGRGVPGIDLSPLGNKMLIEEGRLAAQRNQDLYKFETQWLQDPRSHGSLVGAQQEFDRQHPPEEVAKRSLEKFGFTAEYVRDKDGKIIDIASTGFRSQGDIQNAFAHHWIDKNQAALAQYRLEQRQQANP